MFEYCNFRKIGYALFAGLVVLAITACSGDHEKINSQLARVLGDQPLFSAESSEAVLLRYKFNQGDSHSSRVEFILTTVSERGNYRKSGQQWIDMQVVYKVKSVDSDQSSVLEMMISRIQLKTTGIKNLDYDSTRDRQSSRPEYFMYNAMIDAPIILKINSRGKVLSLDVSRVREKVEKSGNTILLAHLKRMTADMTASAFVQLPEKSVKLGDEFEAGEIRSPIPNVGIMQINTRYKVLSVSADKQKVVLQPLTTYQIKPVKQSLVSMEIKQAEVKAWVLFSVSEGNVLKSSSKIVMSSLAKVQGSNIITRMESSIRYLHN